MHAAIEIIKEKIAVLSRRREDIRAAAKSYEDTAHSQRQMEAKATQEIQELEKALNLLGGAIEPQSEEIAP
ncbi:hypothetical protein D3C87_1209170 [compost metagenome]